MTPEFIAARILAAYLMFIAVVGIILAFCVPDDDDDDGWSE